MPENSLELEVQRDTQRRRWMTVGVIGGGVALLLGIYLLIRLVATGLEMDKQHERAEELSWLSAHASVGNAYYVSMPTPFLFNLPGEDRSYLVQIKVQLQVRSPEAQLQVRKHFPVLKDTLLTTFSAAKPEGLRTREGKLELRHQALANAQMAMQSLTGYSQIERVLFTGFVMQ
ncbi:flagellar basal body-associated FliL family protein [Ferrimonas pelagia]|uniref:Flagellar protein FliL n=1 Tax=Ferrimonas pelagia TaxID=1177826 RepID=A0ABP9EGY5_9GAMM